MNKTELMNCVKTKTARMRFTIKKNSPEILVVAGIVGTVVSTVMACRATKKVEPIIDTAKENLDEIRAHRDDPDQTEYSDHDAKHDITVTYARTGMQLVKLYAPAVTLGALSVTSILTSHDIMRKRNMALAAAYATVDKSYKDYRSRVVDRFGEAVDKELRYNATTEQIEETEVDANGKEKKVKKKESVVDIDGYSEFARFFDESSRNWDKNAEYNLSFLKLTQSLANDKLHAHGHLFLNEVYDMLDIPRTKAGQSIGWIYTKEHPSFVDFGIYKTYRKNREFVNGYERCILLDFNVDGNILNDFDPTFDR